jgi:5-methyltetrahydrofolate--homocysteine methyltransferase
MKILKQLSDAIIRGDAVTARNLTQEALNRDIDPELIIKEYLIPAMDEVGRRFECSEYFVPELLIAARAMKGSFALINPLLAVRGTKPVGKVVIGTVKGDLHDIGKNLVASMLEGAGFEIIDLGVDVAPESFASSVKEEQPTFLALSALLTTTMPSMKKTIDALADAGVRDSVKVLVGGAPVTQRFADEIGADGYGDTAGGAVSIARALLNTT